MLEHLVDDDAVELPLPKRENGPVIIDVRLLSVPVFRRIDLETDVLRGVE